MPKTVQTTIQLHSSHARNVMLKILQARLQQYMNRELPDVQAGFRKVKGTRDQIAIPQTMAGASSSCLLPHWCPRLLWHGVPQPPLALSPFSLHLAQPPGSSSKLTNLFMSLLGLENFCGLLTSNEKILRICHLTLQLPVTWGYSALQLWCVLIEMHC